MFAAVGPVVLLSLAFAAYMNQKFSDDVQSESKALVTVAQRVLAEVIAIQTPQVHTGAQLTDDVMVWTSRVLEQDVNLFQGAQLEATSQRDLFDSGLLPTRTPAEVYRKVALDRLPTAVVNDRLGDVPYLVAAAPIGSSGRDTMLCVPLALRQREIGREIDTLSRGMLVGAVFVILVAAGLGASIAGRISDPVARLTRATRQIAKGGHRTSESWPTRPTSCGDWSTTSTAWRPRLPPSAPSSSVRTSSRPGPRWPGRSRTKSKIRSRQSSSPPNTCSACTKTNTGRSDRCSISLPDDDPPASPAAAADCRRVRQLRPASRAVQLTDVEATELVLEVLAPYRPGLGPRVRIETDQLPMLPTVHVDRTLVSRALTNVVENAFQAMPDGGTLRVVGSATDRVVALAVVDTGVGMDATAPRGAPLLKALFFDQDGRIRPRPGERQAER